MNDLDLAALKSQVNALQKWMSDLAANVAALELQIMAINERVNEHEATQPQPIDINAATVSRLISGIEPGESPTAAPVIPPG